MHAILHSFTYLLKLLTQAPISIQLMPILHTTHNHVHSTWTYRIPNPSAPPFLRVSHSRNSSRRHSTRMSPASGNPSPPTFYPGVSLPESLCVAISSGCLTPGIPLRCHSTRVSHSQNSSPPPFHPDALHPESNPPTFHPPRVSHTRSPLHHHSIRVPTPSESSPPSFHPGVSLPKSLCVAISSGCLTPGIPLRRHSIRVSHSQNSSPSPFHPDALHPESNPPTFHLPRVSHARNPIRRRSTFSGYLTSGILSSQRSTFFFILRALSLGSKITFLIKLCCHFYFWQAIFHTSSVFKMF